MLSKKVRAVLATLGRSGSAETRQTQTNIWVIFMVAIAVRKFQKFESDKYKNSLTFNFDKRAALEELRCMCAADGGDGDGSLGRKVQQSFVVKLAHYVRKFRLTFKDLSSVGLPLVKMCELLKESNSDEKTMYFLCLSLKYLSRNSDDETNPLEISSIAELIGANCKRDLVKNELVALLLYRFEKLHVGQLDRDQSCKLHSLIVNTPDLSQDVKAAILGKLESGKAADRSQRDGKQEKERTKNSMAVRKVKKNQQVVSKTIQTVKAQHETKSSEEVDFEFLNLSDCMRNRNARLNCNTVCDLEPLVKQAGSDQSIFRTTWAEVINLYSVVEQSGKLKDNDKDEYLPERFLGYHYFTGTFWDKDAGKMYSFLINRMCASIYAKITRKQQLNGKAIDGLMKCLIDFESLVKLLDLGTDYVKLLVDKTFQRYKDLKEITSPALVVTFVKKVISMTTEEYLDRGWFRNTIEVRQVSYNRTEVEKIIRAEINEVRLAAIEALYNCAVRDKKTVLTEQRVKTITKFTQREDKTGDEGDTKLTDHIFKLMELAETLDDFNYADAFKTYLALLKPNSTENLDAILRFVTNQARDRNRSKELFTDSVMATLIKLVECYSCYDLKQKLAVLKIITICLEHEGTTGLSDQNLQQLLDNCLQPSEPRLMNAALAMLLLCTDKCRFLSQDTLQKLFAAFEIMSHSEETTSYMVFILSRVFCADDEASQKLHLNNQNFLESVSSKMLCDHIIRLVDDDDDEAERIRFEKPSEDNKNTAYNPSNKISLLAAKIIAKSVEHKVKLSPVTIDNLLLVLQCNEGDKQTMIVAAKCLYGLTRYMALRSGNLNQLLDLINCPIYDVSVYIQAAYLRECVKVAYTSACLDSIHLENISALYVQESLKLGQHDYETEINKNLFKTLLYEARKQKFNDDNIFLLFDSICNLNNKYVPQVLRILVAYSQKYLVPNSTVRTLESLLSVASYFEQALLVLQSFVLNGGTPITSKTLAVFVDNLCGSASSRVRLNSFKLLERVSKAQELPESTFFKLELVRACYALDCRTADKQSVIRFVESVTERGIHLPADTKRALEKEIGDTEVLKIFANVSKRKQIIEPHLLDALIKLFDPKNKAATSNNKILIAIFENAAKNNQSLPPVLLKKLEEAFRLKYLEQNVLSLFIYLAQKGENLSQEVNDKLLDRLACEQDPVLKQELLSLFGSLVVAQKRDIKLYLGKINQILEREITSDNFNIQKLCIATIGKIVMVAKRLDDSLLEKLIEIGTDLNCNRTLRGEIQSLFDSIEDSCNPLIAERRYREKIKLANLSGTSHRQVLDLLRGYLTDSELLVQNYKQLKEVIDNGDATLQEEALNMLLNYRFKGKMTDELLESVAILYESTMSERLSNLCLNLLNLTAESGKRLSGRAHEIWHSKLNRDENINKFLQSSLCHQIKQDLQLDNQVILDLLQLIQDSSAKIDAVQNLAELIELILKETNSEFFNSASFVLLVEGCLLKRMALEVTLPCYCRIVKEQKCCKVEMCLQQLVQCFIEAPQEFDHLETRLFECMYHANKCTQLPDICTSLAVCSLDNSNELVRGYSFGILRTANDKYKNTKYASTLSAWCNAVIESFAKNLKVEIPKMKDHERLDLLEIVVSVKFLDVAVFTKEKRDKWKQELLVSSIFECFKVFPIDQVNFYTNWFAVVDKFKYHKSCKILLLIQNCSFTHFSQILELTLMIAELTFDEVTRMLTNYAPQPYEAFKQDWCTRKILQGVTLSNNKISAKYSSRLAQKLCSLFDVAFIGKLFSCFKSIDNLSAFEGLIDFCSAEKIDLNELLRIENAQLSDVRRLIEAKKLCNCSKTRPKSETEEQNFVQLYQTLTNAGWEFAQLRQLVTAFNPTERPSKAFQNLLHFLHTIETYSLSATANFEKIKDILESTQSFPEMIQGLNKLVVENHFQLEGKVKDLSELTAELKKTNSSDSGLVSFIETGALDIKKHIFEDQAGKLSWNEKQIYVWAKGVREKQQAFTDNEAIAIILRANFLVTGHTLTDTQILSSLIALRRGGNPKGKLLQIATGEGKSTIICILAIINALRGKRVDVITSSPVLAARDAKQKAKLYRMFNLTCADNSDKTVYLRGGKDCYKADIVYGEMSQFQFDILRDNYSKLGTLCGRPFEMAIVDEVDSMLIDDSSKIARLSSTVPGMDHFQALYVIIWQRLLAIKEKFIIFKDTIYFVYGKVDFKDGKICLDIADHDNEIVTIPDLEQYILHNNDLSQVAEIVGDDIDGYLSKSLESYLDAQIKENRIGIPSNFKDFLHKQKSKWIANAVEALNYQENVHYVVQDGEIKPVDYFSTGIVQSSTSWSDGLHQFLQLKHNLKMTSETLTTNFLSNIGYMNKYEKVCGVTGTLGSETARSVFREVYRVDLINIPQRRQKQYLELESVVARDEADWLKAITSNIMLEIQKDRGILVICETIEHANRISDMLKNKLRSSAIKLYTINDAEQEESVEKISAGQVIIATNLAGRGTDIQTDEIEATGGLHVIVTFLPPNERVEGQAFGRTARQGKRGTGLMILNAHSLIDYDASTKNSMKMVRDKTESSLLKEFKEKDLKLIQVKDRLFDTFCTFLNDKIRYNIRKEHNSGLKNYLLNKAINLFTDVQPTTYEVCALAAVEEQWAGFLRKLDEGTIKCEDAEDQCQALIDQLQKDFTDSNFIKNPYYYVNIANDLLVEGGWFSSNASKATRALNYFKKAIELEERKEKAPSLARDEFGEQSDFDTAESKKKDSKQTKSKQDDDSVYSPGAAHLGVAWCSIILKELNYKTNALSSLKTALKCLSNEMSILNATQLLLERRQAGFVHSDLYKQLNVKATILGSYLSGISACIEAINRSKRMIDLVAVKRKGENDAILEIAEHFNELERDEQNTSCFKNNKDLKLSDKLIYSLTFNHLTVKEDSGTEDQALQTLKNAFDKGLQKKVESEVSKLNALKKSVGFGKQYSCLDVKSYRDIRLNLKSIDLARINSALFNPDKEFKELTLEVALTTLKAKRSYSHAARLANSFTASLRIRSIENPKLDKRYENQINELIKIVEEQEIEDKALRFDIVIQRANENAINKLYASSPLGSPLFQLNLDFDNLNQEAIMDKLSTIKATSYDVEFVLNKSKLLEVLKANPTLESAKLHTGGRVFEKVKREELLKRVGELETNETPCYVRFEELKVDQAKSIVASCHQNVLFAVSFVDVIDFYGVLGREEGQVNFSFDKLHRDTAKTFIEVLRAEKIEFSLEFNSLSAKEVRFILKNAILEQEEMDIKKVKKIRELYAEATSPTLELNDFSSKGIEYIIEMMERSFVPWKSVCAVAALGVGQVILGGVLIATGFGSTVGMGLVTEGIADIFIAYRSYSNRQFHWSDYCKQKAISLALSAATMGYSKWKEGAQGAAKGVQTLTTGAGTELLEQAGTQLIYNRKVVGQTLVKSGMNLKSVAAKYIGTKATEAVARECLNTGIQCLSNLSFDALRPQICETVQSRMRVSFSNTELKGILRKMLAIDLVTKSGKLQTQVEKIVADTINPRHDFMRRQWDSIGLPLIKGVLSDSSRYGSVASLSIRFTSILSGLYQVQTLTDNVAKALVTKLRTEERKSMAISVVLHRCLKMKKDRVQVIVSKFNQLDIFEENGNFCLSPNEESSNEDLKAKIDKFSDQWTRNRAAVLKELGSDESDLTMVNDIEKCIKFVERLFAEYVEIDFDSFSILIASASNQIADQMIRIIDSQMVQPFTTLAVSGLVDAVSKRVQDYLVDREQNSESHKADQEKYDKLQQKPSDLLTPEEKAFMARYGKFRTFAEQVNYNSRDYCDAYLQCEMAHYAGKNDSNSSTAADVNVKQMADNVRNGAPANVAVMISSATANGVKLKVVDDANYERTKEDIDNGVQVIYVEPGLNGGVGHAYYMDSNGRFVEAQATGSDCFFGAFSKILQQQGINKSIDDLRAEAAKQIETNSGNFSKVFSAENWIRKAHPDSANNLLFTAGLKKEKGVGEWITVQDKDIDDLLKSIDDKRDAFKKNFQNKVPGKDKDDPTKKTTHHIISKEQIENTVTDSIETDREQFRESVEQYINENESVNQEITYLLDKNRVNSKDHGALLHTAVAFNPNNLVRGPLPKERLNDPNNFSTTSQHNDRELNPNQIDTEIRELQPTEFQQATDPFFNNNQTFDHFRNLPPASQVEWTRDSDSGKYVATEASTAPQQGEATSQDQNPDNQSGFRPDIFSSIPRQSSEYGDSGRYDQL